MKDKEQFLDGVLVSTMKLEAEKHWRIRELESQLKITRKALEMACAVEDWKVEELLDSAEAAIELQKQRKSTPPAPAATSGEREQVKCSCGAWICRGCLSCSSDCGCANPDIPQNESSLIVTRAGVPVTDQKKGLEEFIAACVAPPAVGETAQTAKQEEVGLPELDVTDAERACAESLTEEEWLTAYAMASPIELVAIRYCRERQLRSALKALGEKEAELAAISEWWRTHVGDGTSRFSVGELNSLIDDYKYELAMVRKAFESHCGHAVRQTLLAEARAALESGEARDGN